MVESGHDAVYTSLRAFVEALHCQPHAVAKVFCLTTS